MNRKTIISLVVLVISVTAMVLFYKYDTGKKKKILDQLNKEFPPITVSEQVSGVVSNIYTPYSQIFRDNPLHAYILLDDSLKRGVRTGFELIKQSPLDSILTVGDLLIKKHDSDLLLVCKIHGLDTLKFRFELRDSLGYPIRKRH